MPRGAGMATVRGGIRVRQMAVVPPPKTDTTPDTRARPMVQEVETVAPSVVEEQEVATERMAAPMEPLTAVVAVAEVRQKGKCRNRKKQDLKQAQKQTIEQQHEPRWDTLLPIELQWTILRPAILLPVSAAFLPD